jgi:hypothetical protein
VPDPQWFGLVPAAAQKQGSQDCLMRCVLLRYPSDFLIGAEVLLML